MIVEGGVERVPDADADAYWARGRADRSWAPWRAAQSRPIGSRGVLEDARDTLAAEYPDRCRARSAGAAFASCPDAVEFWQGRADRLHDRLRYRLEGGSWLVERLAP